MPHARSKKGMVKCYHCGHGKPGHLKKNCRLLSNDDGKSKKSSQPGQHKASVGQHSKGECDALVVEHVLQSWKIGL